MTNVVFVGILNITPDSFSDGGLYGTPDAALQQTQNLFDAGAGLVDIGAESTNPSSRPISAAEEIKRLEQTIPQLFEAFGQDVFSLDTYHPETVEWALTQKLRPVVNDISGLHNPRMQQLVIDHDLSIVISHLPKTADGVPTRAHTNDPMDSLNAVRDELLETAGQLEEQGLKRRNIILDPGIGFGKTMRLNWQLLDFARYVPGYAILFGYSRKRFLHTDPTTGAELPEAIELRQQAGHSSTNQQVYTAWLESRHALALARIRQAAPQHKHNIYVRVHTIPQI